MAAQNFKEEDWGDGDTKFGQKLAQKFPSVNLLTKRRFFDY